MKKLKKRNKFDKRKYLVVISFLFAFVMLGFAALSATLGINTDVLIGSIPFDVHFENVFETEGSIQATTSATITGGNKIDFSLNFTEPGEYYEFEVDIVNAGKIDAVLSDIELTGLNNLQKKYLSITYRYFDGTKVKVSDSFPAETTDRIKVRIEFLINISLKDLPASGTVLDLCLNMKFSQDDGTGSKRGENYYFELTESYAVLDNQTSDYVTSSTGIDFSKNPSDTNGKGLYIMAGTEHNEYPIFYYRGGNDNDGDGIEDELNNNVLFANKCWKVVRTTETGGTKLLYNGIPNEGNEKGICANTGAEVHLGTAYFNSSLVRSPGNSGYMYSLDAEKYKQTSKSMKFSGILYNIITPLELSEYENVANDESYPFYFNSATKKWSSDVYGLGSSASITFTVPKDDTYYLDYTIAAAVDDAYVYVNGKSKVGAISGNGSSQVSLGELKSSDVVKVTYTKSSYTDSTTYANKIVFSVGTSTGETIDERIVYGNSVTYEDGEYTLQDTKRLSWGNSLSKYHYTCFSTSDKCETVKYIYNTLSDTAYYISIDEGNDINSVIAKLFPNNNDRNQKNSVIKNKIDNWFTSEEGIAEYVDYLEDTIWCNDRTIASLGAWDPNESIGSNSIIFSPYIRMDNPTLACSNKYDRFTLKNGAFNSNQDLNGNQMLDYPVGVLTSDEMVMIGVNKGTYSFANRSYWSISPSRFSTSYSSVLLAKNTGVITDINYDLLTSTVGVRPAVSLKNGVTAISGTGTLDDPYVITE